METLHIYFYRHDKSQIFIESVGYFFVFYLILLLKQMDKSLIYNMLQSDISYSILTISCIKSGRRISSCKLESHDIFILLHGIHKKETKDHTVSVFLIHCIFNVNCSLYNTPKLENTYTIKFYVTY